MEMDCVIVGGVPSVTYRAVMAIVCLIPALIILLFFFVYILPLKKLIRELIF